MGMEKTVSQENGKYNRESTTHKETKIYKSLKQEGEMGMEKTVRQKKGKYNRESTTHKEIKI